MRTSCLEIPQNITCQKRAQDEGAKTYTEEDHMMVSYKCFQCIAISIFFLDACTCIVNFHFLCRHFHLSPTDCMICIPMQWSMTAMLNPFTLYRAIKTILLVYS